MTESLEQRVRRLAGDRCEYCEAPESPSRLGHVLDHIIAKQNGGATEFDNLALCCGRCNQFRARTSRGCTRIRSRLFRLFNPRQDNWADHFHYDGAVMRGSTDVGVVTISVLSINLPLRIAARQALIERGIKF